MEIIGNRKTHCVGADVLSAEELFQKLCLRLLSMPSLFCTLEEIYSVSKSVHDSCEKSIGEDEMILMCQTVLRTLVASKAQLRRVSSDSAETFPSPGVHSRLSPVQKEVAAASKSRRSSLLMSVTMNDNNSRTPNKTPIKSPVLTRFQQKLRERTESFVESVEQNDENEQAPNISLKCGKESSTSSVTPAKPTPSRISEIHSPPVRVAKKKDVHAPGSPTSLLSLDFKLNPKSKSGGKNAKATSTCRSFSLRSIGPDSRSVLNPTPKRSSEVCHPDPDCYHPKPPMKHTIARSRSPSINLRNASPEADFEVEVDLLRMEQLRSERVLAAKKETNDKACDENGTRGQVRASCSNPRTYKSGISSALFKSSPRSPGCSFDSLDSDNEDCKLMSKAERAREKARRWDVEEGRSFARLDLISARDIRVKGPKKGGMHGY